MTTGEQAQEGRTDGPDDCPLTQMERVVLEAMMEGDSEEETAQRLGIAPGTLRKHLSEANEALGAHRLMKAVRIAVERGYIPCFCKRMHQQRPADRPPR